MATQSFKDLIADAKQRESYWVAKAIQDFTEDLFRLMEERKLSKAELARRIGASPAYITKVLRGNSNFTLETMVRLARAVDAQVCVHLGRNEDRVRWFDVVGTSVPSNSKAGIDDSYSMIFEQGLILEAQDLTTENESPVAA